MMLSIAARATHIRLACLTPPTDSLHVLSAGVLSAEHHRRALATLRHTGFQSRPCPRTQVGVGSQENQEARQRCAQTRALCREARTQHAQVRTSDKPQCEKGVHHATDEHDHGRRRTVTQPTDGVGAEVPERGEWQTDTEDEVGGRCVQANVVRNSDESHHDRSRDREERPKKDGTPDRDDNPRREPTTYRVYIASAVRRYSFSPKVIFSLTEYAQELASISMRTMGRSPSTRNLISWVSPPARSDSSSLSTH